MMTLDEVLTHDGHFIVEGYRGIAWYACGAEEVSEEDTVWSGYKVRTGNVLMVMVGDDRKFVTDPEDVMPLHEDEFCHCCGQIGCQWDGRDRS